MKFYDFASIREAADCRDIARELFNVTIVDGRCPAVWRGGDNPQSVAITKDEFYDHGTKSGGGAIQLAALKFGNIQLAQQWLGDRYHLTPKAKTGPAPERDCRYTRLLAEGYKEVARYEYRDLAGAVRHVTIRLQHPERPGKEFVQGHADPASGRMVWSLKGVETVLYRWPEIANEPWCLICEGEKSADRLAALGIPTTTAAMGAGKWEDSYTDALAGKDIAIAPDNDAVGIEHARLVATALQGKARSVRIVGPLSEREHGGIDDWLDEAPGRGYEAVLAEIARTPEFSDAAELAYTTEITPEMLADAKQANSQPFRNYIPVETETEKRGKKVKETVKQPRSHGDMFADLQRRFLGFPRRVGDYSLFDHDRDTGEIILVERPVQFMSWIARRSKQNPDFTRGDAFATDHQFHESVRVLSRRYEGTSLVPDWPKREEVYYAHDPIPAPCPEHSYLNRFVDMFLPATEFDKYLIKAFVCAPLWYEPGIARPAWIIDSRDGQGSGKTNVVEMVSELYGAPPITVTRWDLERETKEIRKRCVSGTGRKTRIFLVDNVTGTFKSPELAAMISYKHISGMAPYGHGEESRPNNLTFTLTSNNAQVDTDLADRSLFIFVKKPTSEQRFGWKERIQKYVEQYRLNIMSDIIDIVSRHRQYPIPTRTRFAEFEVTILQPCCGSPEATMNVLDHIANIRADSNVDEEQARVIIDDFNHNLSKLGLETTPAFIVSRVVNSWGGSALSGLHQNADKSKRELPIQAIRQLAKIGLIKQVDESIKRWPVSSRSGSRYSGVAWNFNGYNHSATLVYMDAEGVVKTRFVGSEDAVNSADDDRDSGAPF